VIPTDDPSVIGSPGYDPTVEAHKNPKKAGSNTFDVLRISRCNFWIINDYH
jgi:hypothetical protein